jgi:RNA-directed DNA polymerase
MRLAIEAAEWMEGRVLTERNASKFDRAQTQSWNPTMSGIACVREIAKKDRQQSFTALMHHLTPELLRQSFCKLKRQAAKGVDGVSWYSYQEELESRLLDLQSRIQQGRYKPKPARRVYIPKGNGEQRPLSIQCVEDKLVQQAVATLLNQI